MSHDMKVAVIRYTVKSDCIAENDERVRQVYRALQDSQPEGFHYATFRNDDGQFVHVALMAPELSEPPLTKLPAFLEFSSTLGERCDEPPVVLQGLTEVGSYRFVEP